MSKPAARGGDPTNHGGTINPASCSKNVFIGGLPAATVASIHNCPMVTPGTPPVPHVGGPVVSPGVPNILINGMPVIGVGDSFFCAGSPPAQVIAGSGNVIFGGGNSINIPSEPRRQRNIVKEESAERPPFYIKVELGGEYRDKEVPYSIVDADSDDILEEGTISHPFEIETTFPDDVRKVRFFIDGEEMDLGSDYSNSGVGQNSQSTETEDVVEADQIVEMYWSYGEDHKPLKSEAGNGDDDAWKTRYRGDLNFHVVTEDGNNGKNIKITIQNSDDNTALSNKKKEIVLSGIIHENSVVFEKVF